MLPGATQPTAVLAAPQPCTVYSQYLHRQNGSPRTVARPGKTGLSQWPEGFRAGLLLKSESPAWGWRARSVRPGALRQGCRLCFQHLQGNPAVSQAHISLPTCFHSCEGPSWGACHPRHGMVPPRLFPTPPGSPSPHPGFLRRPRHCHTPSPLASAHKASIHIGTPVPTLASALWPALANRALKQRGLQTCFHAPMIEPPPVLTARTRRASRLGTRGRCTKRSCSRAASRGRPQTGPHTRTAVCPKMLVLQNILMVTGNQSASAPTVPPSVPSTQATLRHPQCAWACTHPRKKTGNGKSDPCPQRLML